MNDLYHFFPMLWDNIKNASYIIEFKTGEIFIPFLEEFDCFKNILIFYKITGNLYNSFFIYLILDLIIYRLSFKFVGKIFNSLGIYNSFLMSSSYKIINFIISSILISSILLATKIHQLIIQNYLLIIGILILFLIIPNIINKHNFIK